MWSSTLASFTSFVWILHWDFIFLILEIFVFLINNQFFIPQSDRLADYFANSGLGRYREVIQYHRITGKIAPLLTNADLKDTGIKIVGDRCRFGHQLKALGRKARAVQRNKLIWYGKEKLYFGGVEGCLATCGGICPDDPSTYRLTNNHLKIRLVEPTCVGPIRLCCCAKYSVNNIALTRVDDVNMEGVPAPFLLPCLYCANGKEILDVSTNEGDFYLTAEAGGGGWYDQQDDYEPGWRVQDDGEWLKSVREIWNYMWWFMLL